MKVEEAVVKLTTKQWEAIISILVPLREQELKFEETGDIIKISDLLTDILIELKMVDAGTKLKWDE